MQIYLSELNQTTTPFFRITRLVKFNSVHIYLYSAFQDTHRFKAALHKKHESTLQFITI